MKPNPTPPVQPGAEGWEKKLIEELANLEHRQWVSWAMDISTKEKLSKERMSRWDNLIVTYYDNLSEEMKEQDRKWAKRVIEIIKPFLSSQKQEMMERIKVAERHALDKSYKKYGVLNYDYNNGVFEMRFELEDILSALEKEGG